MISIRPFVRLLPSCDNMIFENELSELAPIWTSEPQSKSMKRSIWGTAKVKVTAAKDRLGGLAEASFWVE